MKFINYLNMHRSRLGYVNCVLLVADVQLDSSIAIRRRLDHLLFYPIFDDQANFQAFQKHLRPDALSKLEQQLARRSLRTSKRARTGVVTGGSALMSGPRAFDIGDLWLLDTSMRSDVGRVLREYSGEPIELARELGLLSAGYALTQFGQMVKLILSERTGEPPIFSPTPNPLEIYEDLRLRLLYMYTLFEADIVLPAMLVALSDGCAPDDALRKALDDLVARIDQGIRLDEVAEARGLYKLRERIAKVRAAGSRSSVETPVYKAQSTPRLEFCVDLGFLNRAPSRNNKDNASYHLADPIQNAATALRGLMDKPGASGAWLDREFFGAAGAMFKHTLSVVDSAEIRLLYFVRGSRLVKRRVGFVPGRVAAMVGCLMAWIDGKRIEIAQMFEQVYAVPRGPWAGYIKFSGGSRLDSEFLVVVEDELEDKLAAAT